MIAIRHGGGGVGRGRARVHVRISMGGACREKVLFCVGIQVVAKEVTDDLGESGLTLATLTTTATFLDSSSTESGGFRFINWSTKKTGQSTLFRFA